MMQLNISTDYAIRAMLYLAILGGKATASEIATAMCIPLNTCKKNLQLLKNAKLITPFPGTSGGYTLAKSPADICLADILRATGEKLEINRCLEPDCFCNRAAVGTCPVHKVYARAQSSLNAAFGTTLQELMNCSTEQMR